MMNDVTVDDIDIEEGDFDDIDSTGDDADIFENVGDRIGKAVVKKRATALTAFNQFFKNAIRLLKRPLPDNSILERRPISDHTSLRAWRLSATFEDRSLL
jgi:hypothetical protein